jgi:hypothetical protein
MHTNIVREKRFNYIEQITDSFEIKNITSLWFIQVRLFVDNFNGKATTGCKCKSILTILNTYRKAPLVIRANIYWPRHRSFLLLRAAFGPILFALRLFMSGNWYSSSMRQLSVFLSRRHICWTVFCTSAPALTQRSDEDTFTIVFTIRILSLYCNE